MSPIGRRRKNTSKKGRCDPAESAAYRAMLADIVQLVKAFKKRTRIRPRLTMRDLKKELGHGR
jgi:hypothetical protein